MNFYYHPILGLQYSLQTEIKKGRFVWTGPKKDSVVWSPDKNGIMQTVVPVKKITTN